MLRRRCHGLLYRMGGELLPAEACLLETKKHLIDPADIVKSVAVAVQRISHKIDIASGGSSKEEQGYTTKHCHKGANPTHIRSFNNDGPTRTDWSMATVLCVLRTESGWVDKIKAHRVTLFSHRRSGGVGCFAACALWDDGGIPSFRNWCGTTKVDYLDCFVCLCRFLLPSSRLEWQ